jgi:hypothetical protein
VPRPADCHRRVEPQHEALQPESSDRLVKGSTLDLDELRVFSVSSRVRNDDRDAGHRRVELSVARAVEDCFLHEDDRTFSREASQQVVRPLEHGLPTKM